MAMYLIGVDIVLRVLMIEKKLAEQYLRGKKEERRKKFEYNTFENLRDHGVDRQTAASTAGNDSHASRTI